MTYSVPVHAFATSARVCAFAFIVAVFSAASLSSATPAAAQGPLTPTNTLQNPAAPAFFSNDFLAGPLSSYSSDAYSQLVVGPTPFAAMGDFAGATMDSSVYRDPSNGELAFVYQFDNTATEVNDLERLTINNASNSWTSYTVYDAGSDGSGSSTSAGGSSHWTNGNPYYFEEVSSNGGVGIQFAIGSVGTLLESRTGDSSAVMWLATSAKNYTNYDVGLSDSSATGSTSAYGPASGVLSTPEPSAIWLAIASVGALLWFVRRRKGLSLCGA